MFIKTNNGTKYQPSKPEPRTPQPQQRGVPQLAPMREVEAFVNQWLNKVGK